MATTCASSSQPTYVGGLFGDSCGDPRGECVDRWCVCEGAWTGRSDILNLEGLDCHLFWPTTCVFMVLTGLSFVRLFKFHVRALRLQYPHWVSKGKPFWLKHRPFRIVLPNLLIALPCVVATCAMRACKDSYLIGVDLPISITYSLGMSITWLTNGQVTRDSYGAVVMGSKLTAHARVAKLKRLMKFNETLLVLSTCTTIVAAFILHNNNARDVRRRGVALLLTRNVSAIVSFSLTLFHLQQWVSLASSLKEMLAPPTGTGARNSILDRDRRVVATLNGLIDHARRQRRDTVVRIAAFVLFTVWPKLWGYQSIVFAIEMSLVAGRTHSVFLYIPIDQRGASFRDFMWTNALQAPAKTVRRRLSSFSRASVLMAPGENDGTVSPSSGTLSPSTSDASPGDSAARQKAEIDRMDTLGEVTELSEAPTLELDA